MANLDLQLEPGDARSVPTALELAQELTDERDRTRLKERLRDQLELYSIWLRDQIWLLSGAPSRKAPRQEIVPPIPGSSRSRRWQSARSSLP